MNIPDFIVRGVIILLLFAVLFLNVIEISNFVNSRVKMLSLSSKESNPSYDSLITSDLFKFILSKKLYSFPFLLE